MPSSKADRIGTFYDTKAKCEAAVDEVSHEVSHLPALPAQNAGVRASAEPTGKVDLLWRDCGSATKRVNFTGVTPATTTLGGKTRIKASGSLSQSIESANLTVKMASGAFGLTLASFEGECCSESHGTWTLLDQVHLSWKSLGCPLAPGEFISEIDLWVSPAIPDSIAHTTTTLVMHDQGEESTAWSW